MSTENLTKPAIQSEIQARHRVTAAELALSRSDVIAAVLGAIQTAREQCDPATVIRGIMTIAKMMGFDKPEPPVAWQSVPLSPGAERLKAKFAAMSDAELMEIIAARE